MTGSLNPSDSLWSFTSRSSCCRQCAEPVWGPDGGEAQCVQCGHRMGLRPRVSFARALHVQPPGEQPAAFRLQASSPSLPPPNIAFLWEDGGTIPAHREQEARAAWQSARVRSVGMDPGAGEELCTLTRELALHAERRGELVRMRALLEAALEDAPLPRQRAVLLGLLARTAARRGDTDSAAAWLACFEPPQGLEADSELRLTCAVVATAQGDFDRVLSLLGSELDQFVIQEALVPLAVLLRCNATERRGSLLAAAQQILASCLRQQGMLRTLERIQETYERLALCHASLSAARRAREEQQSQAGAAERTVGGILLACSILVAVIVLCSVLGSYLSDGSLSGLWALLSIPFPAGLMGLIGLKTLRAGQRQQRIFVNGVHADALVYAAEPTGTLINDDPEMRLTLDVQLDPPLRSSLCLCIPVAQQRLFVPGTILAVRLDLMDPDLAVLDV